MAAAYAIDRYKEALTCGICKDTLTDPRTLPCLHQYCFKCLNDLVKKSGLKGRKFNCPECRHVCHIPQGGLQKLKVSPTMTFLLDAYNDTTPTQIQEANCTVCFETDERKIPAEVKCLDCNKRFCVRCRKTHDSVLPHHKLHDLTGDHASDFETAVKSIKERTVFCQKHPTKPLELYCKRDKVVMCYLCHTIDHTGHAVEDINETSAKNKKPIGAVITQGNQLVDVYEQAIQDTQTYKTQLEQNTKSIIAKINNDMNNLIQAVRNKYTSYKDQVLKKKKANLKQVISHLGQLELQKAIVESQIQKYCSMVDHGHPVEIAGMTKHVLMKTKEWSKQPNVDFDEKLDIKFKDGNIKDDNVSFGVVLIKKAKITIYTTLLSSKKVHPSNIEGLFVTPAGDYVVTGRDTLDESIFDSDGDESIFDSGGDTSKVSIYNSNFQLKKELGHMFEKGTLTNDGDLAFTDRSNTIKLFHSDGTFKHNIVCKGVSSLAGITVNSKGEFVVCDKNSKKVYHIDPRTGEITAETPDGMFENPFAVTCNSKDLIIVSNVGLKENILGIWKNNIVAFIYDRKKSGVGNFVAALDVCTDESDNIFVAQVCGLPGHILNPYGEFISEIEPYVESFAIDNEGHPIGGDCDGYIHTFTTENKCGILTTA